MNRVDEVKNRLKEIELKWADSRLYPLTPRTDLFKTLDDCRDLIAEVESLQRADIRNHEIMASYAEEKAELEARVCSMQEALDEANEKILDLQATIANID